MTAMTIPVLCAVFLLMLAVASESRSPPLEVIAIDDDDILEAFLVKSSPRGGGRFIPAARKLWTYQRETGEGLLGRGNE